MLSSSKRKPSDHKPKSIYRKLSLCEGKSLTSGYRLDKVLGQSETGEVWQAESKTGQLVALKFIKSAAGTETGDEVRSHLMVRDLAHPNLVKVDHVWADRGY